MIYDTLSKGEDGLYHSRALNDEKKRYFVQLNECLYLMSIRKQVKYHSKLQVKTTRRRSNLFTLSIFSLHWKIVRRGLVKNFQRRRFQGHIPEVRISKLIVFLQHVFSITTKETVEFSSVNVGMNVQTCGIFRTLVCEKGIWSNVEYCPNENSRRKNSRSQKLRLKKRKHTQTST